VTVMTETEPPPSFEFTPIGWVRSTWPEKFGIPRQSGLTRGLEARIELRSDIPNEALRGLEGVSHVWVLSWFHACVAEGWNPTVRPPRLGGATRLGVFATRAPHRPNPIGLSLVRLLHVGDRELVVADLDLLDGTPVLDLKPHLPWAEQPADARCEWAATMPEPLEVRFDATVGAELSELERHAIIETLRWDPRPAHLSRALGNDPSRSFGVAVANVDVRFRVDAANVDVVECVQAR
jgi:tRNA-Thr(GGU) m(6)t(6)A37 methyltransferase TsaA